MTLNYQVIYKEKLACDNCLVWKHYSKYLQKLKNQCWFSALDWIFSSKNFYMECSTKTFLAFVFLFFFVTYWNFTFILFSFLWTGLCSHIKICKTFKNLRIIANFKFKYKENFSQTSIPPEICRKPNFANDFCMNKS